MEQQVIKQSKIEMTTTMIEFVELTFAFSNSKFVFNSKNNRHAPRKITSNASSSSSVHSIMNNLPQQPLIRSSILNDQSMLSENNQTDP